MCGIYGIIALQEGLAVDPALLAPMAALTLHRGPDDEGRFQAPGLAMGMRRLSIIDVAGGDQPIANEDETLWLICNGEIYNFRELRSSLQAAGHRFRTGSDSEVILHLYEEHGLACVDHLTGMYGFALWDAPQRRLVLARDRIGIKPLYYQRQGNRLVFASEIKAILGLPGASARLSEAALEDYLGFGYSDSESTLFADIALLPPSGLLVCEAGELQVQRTWSSPRAVDPAPSAADWSAAVAGKIEAAVRAEMVSDVPLGAFLSGGIDSSAIVSFMAKHSSEPVKTYSIGFRGQGAGAVYNELPYARQVAARVASDHHEIIVQPSVAELLPKLIWHLDEPIADSAFITTYLVSSFARQDVTVILSGVGGDELFGGYNRYLGDHYAGRYLRLPRWLRRGLIAPLVQALPSDRHGRFSSLARYARAFVASSELPFEARYRHYVQIFGAAALERLLGRRRRAGGDLLDAAFETACGPDPLNVLMNVDLLTQMPNDLLMLTDKMSMAASLECRVPLLNHELVELAARIPAAQRIPGRRLKHILKLALAEVLSQEILERRKRGFGAPIGAWFKRDLEPLIAHLLSPQSIARRGALNGSAVAETIALHASGREDHTDHLMALVCFEIWARLYLDGRSVADVTEELQAVSLPSLGAPSLGAPSLGAAA